MRPEMEEKVNGETASAIAGMTIFLASAIQELLWSTNWDMEHILEHIHMSKDEFIPVEGIIQLWFSREDILCRVALLILFC